MNTEGMDPTGAQSRLASVEQRHGQKSLEKGTEPYNTTEFDFITSRVNVCIAAHIQVSGVNVFPRAGVSVSVKGRGGGGGAGLS